MLETWFWWQNQCFVAWGIIWDYFQKPQIDLKATNRVEGLKEVNGQSFETIFRGLRST